MDYNIEEEVWKDIEGYEGLYRISTLGRVWNVKRRIFMKPKNTKGYLMVGLTKNKKQRWLSIHRLVAGAFIEKPNGKTEVNHLDEDVFNNSVHNLSWVTPKENSNWGTRTERMTESIINNYNPSNRRIIQICNKTNVVVNEFHYALEASRRTGVNYDGIYRCLKGTQKTSEGYRWQYKFI